MLEKVYKTIDIKKIKPNKNQPRSIFNDDKISELSQSIKENGLLQPIIVRKEKNHYLIIAGERRYRACKNIGLDKVPCIVKDFNDVQVETLAIIENIQREDLTPLEEAKAYKSLLNNTGLNQQALADKIGRKQSTIANKLRLLKLGDDVKLALDHKQITERHARAMLSLDESQQVDILREVLKNHLNVSQTERLINKPSKPKKEKKVVTKKVSKNVRVAINTIKQATDMITKTGVDVIEEHQDKDDEYIITLRVKK